MTTQPSQEPAPFTNEDLKERMEKDGDDTQVLDVRETFELHSSGKIPNSLHIPMGEVPHRLNDLAKDKYVVVYCAGGVRSYDVGHFLLQNGFTRVGNLENGINGWDGERESI